MKPDLVYELYEQYKTGIFRFALSILRQSQLAEDALQETFLRLLSGRANPIPGKEQAFLYRVARNICYDILRKRKRETEEAQNQPAPTDRWEFLELIAPLSQKEQEIVSLKIIGGLTHAEIAKIIGTTTAGAKKRYERAIEKLRTEMEVLSWKKN